jgi:hypothetical protein
MRKLVAAGIATVVLCGLPSNGALSAQQPAELDQLLAPIALYPDALLGQMLLCATTPAKIGALEEWLRSQDLKGTELQNAAVAAGFDQSLAAIVLFPDVVSMMASQMDWTSRLGQAFTADRSAVFASIQRLRAKAAEAGTLKDSPQQNIETRSASNGQQVIVIEPANPQVVYVPQYNPQTVYTTSTVVVQDDDDDGAAVAAGVIGFTAGIALGAAMDNDYYYGPYGWRGGAYMYDDAWDDWADHREDAREDWIDHREDAREDYADRREDVAEQRGERSETAQQQRTERTEARQANRPEAQAQAEQRQAQRQASGTAATSAESRGASRDTAKASERSGTRSDAFSGYSSGRSERAASSRGQRSRSSGSRSGGGRRR